MVKHNNEVPHAHFHKDWDQRIRLWFNQPAKAAARREARKAKAAKVAPRPVNLLRSAVHCPTVKYNSRVRLGRGFSLEELRAAGVSPKSARNIGIAVDHRRKNRSEEHFAVNVDRLKAYKARLVVFPRKANKPKKGDATAEQIAAVTQVTSKNVLALPIRKAAEAPRAITAAERARTVSSIVRTALTDGKMWGMREKRAKINAEKKAAQSKKDAKKEDADE